MEHALEYFSFYVQKHIAHLAACSGHPAGSRRAARGARISETCLLKTHFTCCTSVQDPAHLCHNMLQHNTVLHSIFITNTVWFQSQHG